VPLTGGVTGTPRFSRLERRNPFAIRRSVGLMLPVALVVRLRRCLLLSPPKWAMERSFLGCL
jgi:hypothetical protein